MLPQWTRFFVVSNIFKALIPNQAPEDDTLFNRRRLAYFGLAFSIYWTHLILAVYIWGPTPDAVCITAFLGVPATLAGLGFYKYLRAAETEDAIKNGNNSSTPIGNTTVSVTVDNKQPNEGQETTDGTTGQSASSPVTGTDLKRKPD